MAPLFNSKLTIQNSKLPFSLLLGFHGVAPIRPGGVPPDKDIHIPVSKILGHARGLFTRLSPRPPAVEDDKDVFIRRQQDAELAELVGRYVHGARDAAFSEFVFGPRVYEHEHRVLVEQFFQLFGAYVLDGPRRRESNARDEQRRHGEEKESCAA